MSENTLSSSQVIIPKTLKIKKYFESHEVQTVLSVLPHVLAIDQEAKVFVAVAVQTFITWPPEKSATNLVPLLGAKLQHVDDVEIEPDLSATLEIKENLDTDLLSASEYTDEIANSQVSEVSLDAAEKEELEGEPETTEDTTLSESTEETQASEMSLNEVAEKKAVVKETETTERYEPSESTDITSDWDIDDEVYDEEDDLDEEEEDEEEEGVNPEPQESNSRKRRRREIAHEATDTAAFKLDEANCAQVETETNSDILESDLEDREDLKSKLKEMKTNSSKVMYYVKIGSLNVKAIKASLPDLPPYILRYSEHLETLIELKERKDSFHKSKQALTASSSVKKSVK